MGNVWTLTRGCPRLSRSVRELSNACQIPACRDLVPGRRGFPDDDRASSGATPGRRPMGQARRAGDRFRRRSRNDPARPRGRPVSCHQADRTAQRCVRRRRARDLPQRRVAGSCRAPVPTCRPRNRLAAAGAEPARRQWPRHRAARHGLQAPPGLWRRRGRRGLGRPGGRGRPAI